MALSDCVLPNLAYQYGMSGAGPLKYWTSDSTSKQMLYAASVNGIPPILASCPSDAEVKRIEERFDSWNCSAQSVQRSYGPGRKFMPRTFAHQCTVLSVASALYQWVASGLSRLFGPGQSESQKEGEEKETETTSQTPAGRRQRRRRRR